MRVGEHRRARRMPLREAAVALGVSKDAVRQRIRRGTLRSDKGEDGRVYVCLDAFPDDVYAETPQGGRDPALVDELRDRVRYLEGQVEEERDARRRTDTLLAQLMQRIPELEAPQERPEASETVEHALEVAEPRSAEGAARDELGVERARREMAETTLQEGMAEERQRREAAERERDDLRGELFALRGREEAYEAAEEQQGRGQPPSDAGEARREAKDTPAYWWPTEKTAEDTTPRSRAGGAREGGARPRSWWRRMLGR
jgi:hypothetical protein